MFKNNYEDDWLDEDNTSNKAELMLLMENHLDIPQEKYEEKTNTKRDEQINLFLNCFDKLKRGTFHNGRVKAITKHHVFVDVYGFDVKAPFFKTEVNKEHVFLVTSQIERTKKNKNYQIEVIPKELLSKLYWEKHETFVLDIKLNGRRVYFDSKLLYFKLKELLLEKEYNQNEKYYFHNACGIIEESKIKVESQLLPDKYYEKLSYFNPSAELDNPNFKKDGTKVEYMRYTNEAYYRSLTQIQNHGFNVLK